MRTFKGIIIVFVAVLTMQAACQAAAKSLISSREKIMTTPYNPYSSIPVVEDGQPEDIRLPAVEKGSWLDRYKETGMTFIEYVTSDTPRPSSTRCTIVLQSIGTFRDSRSMEKIGRMISAYYQLPVKILPQKEIDTELYSPLRRKYDADEILFNMYEKLPEEAFAYVALTDKDMYSGRLGTVFGLAYCDLRSCVISTAHLCGQKDEISDRYELMRVCKLVCHELGHVMGLPHCAAHICAMNGTTSLSDIEDAPFTLCGPCLKKLQWNIGFDRLKRYEAINTVMKEINCNDQTMAFAVRIQRLRLENMEQRSLALAHGRKVPVISAVRKNTPRRTRIYDLPLVAAIEEE